VKFVQSNSAEDVLMHVSQQSSSCLAVLIEGMTQKINQVSDPDGALKLLEELKKTGTGTVPVYIFSKRACQMKAQISTKGGVAVPDLKTAAFDMQKLLATGNNNNNTNNNTNNTNHNTHNNTHNNNNNNNNNTNTNSSSFSSSSYYPSSPSSSYPPSPSPSYPPSPSSAYLLQSFSGGGQTGCSFPGSYGVGVTPAFPTQPIVPIIYKPSSSVRTDPQTPEKKSQPEKKNLVVWVIKDNQDKTLNEVQDDAAKKQIQVRVFKSNNDAHSFF